MADNKQQYHVEGWWTPLSVYDMLWNLQGVHQWLPTIKTYCGQGIGTDKYAGPFKLLLKVLSLLLISKDI